ncbi:MAG: glycosyltransferase family 1 protein [Clostridiaceae bacterium]|nr:glycosyltransferase family 1 protein [Clostridiaceae bacterium]
MDNEYRDIKPLFETKKETPFFNLEIEYPVVVIYPPTIDWNYMKQRPQQIMEQFSLNGFEVFYCNKTQSSSGVYTSINPNLKIVHNNAGFINEVVPRLKEQGKKIILWVSWSKLHLFLDHYSPDFVIYDYLDDFAAWEPYLEPMVRKSDVVITTSEILMDRMEKGFPQKPSFMIPNGCDLNHFRPKRETIVPAEFSEHKGPVITYSGAWANWIDTKLVEKIALNYKNALIAIIGTEFGTKVPKHIPNLKYLGYKSYAELPMYLQNSTVCIIPFLINPITLATNPIKMYEYLAAGRPVVSTNIPEAQNVPGVYIGRTHEEFIEKIGLILEKDIAFDENTVYPWLEAHTWEQRFKEIHRIINEYFLLNAK